MAMLKNGTCDIFNRVLGQTTFLHRLRCFRFLLAVVMVCSMAGIAQADCWYDVIDRVDRDLIAMRSGAVYQLLDDPNAVTFWMPLSQVAICDQAGYFNGQPINYFMLTSNFQTVRAVLAQ
jgi:hypothetical protein